MSNEKNKIANVVSASPSKSLIIEWMLKGELWRLGIGEDPDWGQHPVDQIIIQATIHELANNISDQEAREQVQTNIAKSMANTVQQMVKASK